MRLTQGLTRRRALFAFSVFGCAAKARPADARQARDIRDIFDRTHHARMLRDPTLAAISGYPVPHDRWTLRTERWFRASLAELNRASSIAATHAKSNGLKLNLADDLELFLYDLDLQRNEIKWRRHEYAFYAGTAPQNVVPFHLRSFQQVSDSKTAETYLRKLEGAHEFILSELDRFDEQHGNGIRPPSFNFAPMIAAASLAGSDAATSRIVADFESKLAAADVKDRDSLLERARDYVEGALSTAFRECDRRLRLAAQSPTFNRGVWALPDGANYYAAQIVRHTTLELDPNEVHELGVAKVAHLREELALMSTKLGFSRDATGFLQHLRTAPALFEADTEEGRQRYMARAQAYADASLAAWSRITRQVKRQPLDVRRAEPQPGGRAAYFDPAVDGSRPGFVQLNVFAMAANPTYQLAALMFHEGVPGHHLQACAAQAAQDAPMFRKQLYIGSYSEGWALYAERLADELGLYEDDWGRAGKVALELFRAVRLVVDSGIHHKRWTYDEAISYMNENTANPFADNVAEVQRYFNWPGQALGYMIGMDFILAARARAEAARRNFDLAEFHDAVLVDGAAPLDMLARRLSRQGFSDGQQR